MLRSQAARGRNFNPRSHEGSDRFCPLSIFVRRIISIHAPTRGATPHWLNWKCSSKFQSTLPRGERPGGEAGAEAILPLFQSTLPRGERQWQHSTVPLSQRFQSTLPRGERRRPECSRSDRCGISIHAPTRGATRCGF